MKYLLLIFCMTIFPIYGQQVIDEESVSFIVPKAATWKEKSKVINYLGLEAYGNSGNLHKSEATRLWAANSFTWELYYAASIPNYNWISIGTGIELGASVNRNNEGTVFDRFDNESFYFIYQVYLNISPWFTLHANSEGRIEFRSRYTATFSNPVNGNFGHFLLTEFIFGFFLIGNEVNVNTGEIDEFWITSPSISFLYYIQFHKNVGFRWYSEFYVNNGLFYNSGVSASESIPMEHYARLDFILGNGITLWARVQWNIYNSDFNDAAFFANDNPFDVQLRAGIIFVLDFATQSTRNL